MPETTDWEAGVDILTQSLTRLAQRPSYGAEQFLVLSGSVPANAKTAVGQILGKGIIIGAYFTIESTGIIDNDFLTIAIDGQELDYPTTLQLFRFNMIRGPKPYGYISIYDNVNFRYGGAADQGGTFEISYVFYYTETYGRTPTLSLKLGYALAT